MRDLRHRVAQWCLLLTLTNVPVLAAQGPEHSAKAPASTGKSTKLTTEDHVQAPGWWPTKGAASRSDYVGTAQCAQCHREVAVSYIATPMAQASAPAAYSVVLQSNPNLSARVAGYRYEASREGSTVNFMVADDTSSISAALTWAFGVGRKGQTYLYQRTLGSGASTAGVRNAAFNESRVSFYSSLEGLDLTTGHNADPPENLDTALGRHMDPEETRRCFGCHATASTIANRFDPSHVIPGLNCEACHGPGARHVDALSAGKIDEGRRAIFSPRTLDPVASVDFCGACHRTWGDVVQGQFTGVVNARFQPYRLETSRCWQKGDARLRCTACHDPHQPLIRDAASYDHNCLACHAKNSDHYPSPQASAGSRKPAASGEQNADHSAAPCPVSANNCVTCHMPQVEVPGMHATFTDHRMRTAREGQPYPN